MAELQLRSATRDVRLVAGAHGDVGFQADAQLLDAFVRLRDEAAIEMLVWRHGSMVMNLCRRVLHDEHQAEDAFQAAFLELVRHAGSIGKGQSVSSWLFKVAYRVAQRQRAKLTREPQQRANIDDFPGPAPADTLIWRELRPVLDEEIERLPEKYRAPIVLCYLEGHTTGEAAEVLQRPRGTVLCHLSRGREQLRSRLTRRGIALSAAWLGTHLAMNAASAAVPPALIDATLKSAVAGTPDKAALDAGSRSAPAKGASKTMFLAKLKLIAAALFAAVGLSLAGVAIAPWVLGDSDQGRQAEEDAADDEANVFEPGAGGARGPGSRQGETAKSTGPIRYE